MKNTIWIVFAILLYGCNTKNTELNHEQKENLSIYSSSLKSFNNITLEMSLKPFKKNNTDYIQAVCKEVFTQWASLLRHADTISIMLWTSDGSEILDYSGNLNQKLEWAKYMGNPNTSNEVNSYPDSNLTLHERAFTYMKKPPKFTYKDLKLIVTTLKETGDRMTGKPIRVCATFDPGPEFARSDFKYKKHPEVCMSNTMGAKSFVTCYAVLNKDKEKYAGYPHGIKQGTPFGSFFGRQSKHFLRDLGFDCLWLSNGFGFGMETWSSTGAIFDGEKFHAEKLDDIKAKILDFWTLFREECPEIRIETRGTNLSTSIDLAADGVDLKSIYEGNYNILPPPNSPWAAINGDFGLEMAGYMSRICEKPDNRFLFRYYTHDPWWLNSPWLDRYGREPHDIYLPMAVATINSQGQTENPTHLNFLTIDDSYGNMPKQVPDEVIPHILQARRYAPDKAGVLLWVYPFDEYHDWAFNHPERLKEIYYGDWFIRQAINEGFPLNTCISTKNFVSVYQKKPEVFSQSVLVTIAPEANTPLEAKLIDFVQQGGKAMVYGPVTRCSDRFLEFMNIKLVRPLEGVFEIQLKTKSDDIKMDLPDSIYHDAFYSGGPINTQRLSNKNNSKVLTTVKQGVEKRDVALVRHEENGKGGAICYIRGTNSVGNKGGRLLRPLDKRKWYSGNILMRYALLELGYELLFEKESPLTKNPVNTISRNDNAYYFSGFVPNTTVKQKFKFPMGAPVFIGLETRITNGYSTYNMPKSYFKECRFFIEQEEGIISCFEIHSGEKGIKRRIGIKGLENATVRFYPPENADINEMKIFHNSHYPYKKGQIQGEKENRFRGKYILFRNISGQLTIGW
ncbi:MAG TPA: hypothetical protein VJ896_13165 [Bacteroidales bacterium]|nr:hypothetical protein [Bacteroidales bacterium]